MYNNSNLVAKLIVALDIFLPEDCSTVFYPLKQKVLFFSDKPTLLKWFYEDND